MPLTHTYQILYGVCDFSKLVGPDDIQLQDAQVFAFQPQSSTGHSLLPSLHCIYVAVQ